MTDNSDVDRAANALDYLHRKRRDTHAPARIVWAAYAIVALLAVLPIELASR
jgi:hypothetical protein